MNRKLIRPRFEDVKNKDRDSSFERADGHSGTMSRKGGFTKPSAPRPSPAMPDGTAPSSANQGKPKKPVPLTETNAEVFYYKKQIDSHTLMVIVLHDGEEIEGTIEWYDKDALKINRKSLPNVMLLKHNIKYMYKAEER